MSSNEAAEIILENNLNPKDGPYSFSTLELCPLSFKFYKIDKKPGATITRFGTDVGQAKHILAEHDVRMRMTLPADKWISAEVMVDRLIQKMPQYIEYIDDLTSSLQKFRFNFDIDSDKYLESELRLGCDFNMKPTKFDDPSCWFRGLADYIEVSNGIARLVDFKNYPTIHSDAQILDISEGVGRQLFGYGALLMAAFPQITGFYYEVYYFRYGVSKRPFYKNEAGEMELKVFERSDVESWWKNNQRKMLAFEMLDEYTPAPSQRKCQYCSYVNDCTWMNTERGESDVIVTTDEEAHNNLKKLIILEEQRERIRSALKEYVAKDKGFIESEDYFFGYKETESSSIDPKVFMDICRNANIDPSKYVSVTSTNINKVKKLLDEASLKKMEDAIIVKKRTRFSSR